MLCLERGMRSYLAAPVSFALASCLVLGISVDACGGTTVGNLGPDGGVFVPVEAGGPLDAGDATLPPDVA